MDFDFSPIVESWAFLLSGIKTTLLLSFLCVLASLVLGTLAAIGRVYGPRLLGLAITFYVDTMRAIPLLVVMVWIYFALPIASGLNLPPFWSAMLAITVHVTATVTEIVRAGLESIRPGQTRAGLALGMSRSQVIRKIILPQAAFRMLPAFGSVISITIKDTAIASVIAVPELMKQSETVASQSFRPIEVFTCAMVAYFLILLPTTRGIDRIYRRLAHLGRS
jgi:polar amino acid transport system permease protein